MNSKGQFLSTLSSCLRPTAVIWCSFTENSQPAGSFPGGPGLPFQCPWLGRNWLTGGGVRLLPACSLGSFAPVAIYLSTVNGEGKTWRRPSRIQITVSGAYVFGIISFFLERGKSDIWKPLPDVNFRLKSIRVLFIILIWESYREQNNKSIYKI